MKEKTRILVVDDEADLIRLIEYNLQQEGYEVLTAEDGEEAINVSQREKPDLVLLDLMLPRLPGMEVCRLLKEDPETRRIPVIMLTAKGEVKNRIEGLESGADDYVCKPFHVRELLSRIRAVLRRARPPVEEEVIRIGPCSIDFGAHKVLLHGEEVVLSPTEFNLFSYLVKKRGRVCTREQILDKVWGMDAFVEPRTVDVHIRRLRARIGTKTSSLIRTIRGVGYTFEEGEK